MEYRNIAIAVAGFAAGEGATGTAEEVDMCEFEVTTESGRKFLVVVGNPGSPFYNGETETDDPIEGSIQEIEPRGRSTKFHFVPASGRCYLG